MDIGLLKPTGKNNMVYAIVFFGTLNIIIIISASVRNINICHINVGLTKTKSI